MESINRHSPSARLDPSLASSDGYDWIMNSLYYVQMKLLLAKQRNKKAVFGLKRIMQKHTAASIALILVFIHWFRCEVGA